MSRYASQKFFEAVSALIGASTIDKRLTFAALPLLVLQAGAIVMSADDPTRKSSRLFCCDAKDRSRSTLW
jgi:hypothetical protein